MKNKLFLIPLLISTLAFPAYATNFDIQDNEIVTTEESIPSEDLAETSAESNEEALESEQESTEVPENENVELNGENYKNINVTVTVNPDSIQLVENRPITITVYSDKLNSTGQTNVKIGSVTLSEANNFTNSIAASVSSGIYVEAKLYGDTYGSYKLHFNGYENESFFGTKLNGYISIANPDTSTNLELLIDAPDEEITASENSMSSEDIAKVFSGSYKEEKESAIAESVAAENVETEVTNTPSRFILAAAIALFVGFIAFGILLYIRKKDNGPKEY